MSSYLDIFRLIIEGIALTIVKAFKELKDSVKALEDKVDKTQNQEVKEIMENQKMLEDLLKAKSEAIRKIDSDIIRIQNENFANQKKEEENSKERLKKCKFFNSGHCKYRGCNSEKIWSQCPGKELCAAGLVYR
jgi:hypothetical protein